MKQTDVALPNAEERLEYTLLCPGPVQLSPTVERALSGYDPRRKNGGARATLPAVIDKLQRIFRATPEHAIALFDGGGATAIECAIASTVPRDRKILVIDNGALGERLHGIARRYGMDVVHLRYAWGDLVQLADVERALEQHADIAVVAMAHHETSVGLLNPIAEVGALCRRFDALCLIDAESSLGAEDLAVVRDNVDICTSGADACLHSVGGVAILCVAPRVWPKIETIKSRSHGLDLVRHLRALDTLTGAPFAPCKMAYRALDAACAEFLQDGHGQRQAMYRQRNDRLRRGLSELGLAPFTRTGRESHSVVTCCIPTGLTFDELYEGLASQGYIVSRCSDVLAETFMQVANMGALDEGAVDGFLSAVSRVLTSLRRKAPMAAAQRSDAHARRPAA